MDGKKTTWRVSKNYSSLSIKISSTEKSNFFLKFEDKKVAEQRREDEKRIAEEKELLKKNV